MVGTATACMFTLSPSLRAWEVLGVGDCIAWSSLHCPCAASGLGKDFESLV